MPGRSLGRGDEKVAMGGVPEDGEGWDDRWPMERATCNMPQHWVASEVYFRVAVKVKRRVSSKCQGEEKLPPPSSNESRGSINENIFFCEVGACTKSLRAQKCIDPSIIVRTALILNHQNVFRL